LTIGRFQWLKEQLILWDHEIECLKAQQSLDAMMDEIRILFQTDQGREAMHFKTILDDRYHSSCVAGYCELHLLQIFLDNAILAHYTMTVPRKLGDKFVTPQSTILVVDDKSVNTTYFYPRDRAISIKQNICIIPEPMLHTIRELDLEITPLRDTATSLGKNIFLICSGDNYIIQYRYRNMSMIDNEAQDKTHDTFIDRTQERPEGCIILENAYKINVTFKHQPNPIFNNITY
jgi:hypothetical protein